MSPGCSASGWSGRYGSWVTTTSGSTCGTNGTRFRGWGFYGPWVNVYGSQAADTSPDPTLYGGGDHRRCTTCPVSQT